MSGPRYRRWNFPGPEPGGAEASAIVCFDAYVTNVDRTAKNPNLLVWHRALWLIDHGASLYFHHSWDDYRERSQSRFPPVKDHVLLRWASALLYRNNVIEESGVAGAVLQGATATDGSRTLIGVSGLLLGARVGLGVEL